MSTPQYIWWNGAIRPFAEAQVHVTSETAVRGTNIFEGLRAYWRPSEGRYAIIALAEHMERLRASARLLHLQADDLIAGFPKAVSELIHAADARSDLYIRTAVYLLDGRYTADSRAMNLGSYVVAYPVERSELTTVSAVLSNWVHLSDSVFPTAAKVGAAYSILRMARIEAAQRGAEESILLNDRGFVAETAGAAVFMVRRGRLLTPPLSDGILDSITRRIVIELATDKLGVKVVEQSLSKSDVLTADEVFITGTLDEIKAISSLDGFAFAAPGPLTTELSQLYQHLCRGSAGEGEQEWISFV